MKRRIIEDNWKNFLNKMNDHGLQRLLNGNKFYSRKYKFFKRKR